MTTTLLSTSYFKKTILLQSKVALEMYRVKYNIKMMCACALFNETNVPHDLLQGLSFQSYNVKTVIW